MVRTTRDGGCERKEGSYLDKDLGDIIFSILISITSPDAINTDDQRKDSKLLGQGIRQHRKILWVRSLGHSRLFWWGTSTSQTSAGIIIQLTGNISGLNAFFASVFNNKTCYSLGTQPPALVDRDGDRIGPA